jgi:peptidoglycan/LPS O-acetylase OafA/YrhL
VQTAAAGKSAVEFRADINGLRGVAVLAVVLFHFGTPGASGGYVGVDVFFVISGYLMTRITWPAIANGRLEIVSFYLARARRILPALAVMVAVVLAFGYLYLLHLDYRSLSKHAAAALAFLSNFTLWRERDYFASEGTWLLHTWSLSVEGQFYMLFPLLLVGLRAIGFLRVGVLATLVAISFALSVAGSVLAPNASFYLLPTRIWELLAGSVAYFLKWPGMSWLGIALVVLSVVGLSPDVPFPGHLAAVPVVGAALILVGTSTNRLLASAVPQFFGDISYSFYLWHWPLLVAVKYLEIPLTALVTILTLFASTGLGWLSYRYVEQTTRKRFHLRPWIGVTAALGALAVTAYLFNGVPQRFAPPIALVAGEAANSNPKRTECMGRQCAIGRADVAPSVLLWGDSHADVMSSPLGIALARRGEGGVVAWLSSCPPIREERPGRNCVAFNNDVRESLSQSGIRTVVLAGRWSAYARTNVAEDVVHAACRLRRMGLEVHVVEPVPEMPHNVPRFMAKSLLLTGATSEVSGSLQDYAARNDAVLAGIERARRECGIGVLRPTKFLCDGETCFGSRHGWPLYFDDNHLSEVGNRDLIRMFEEALK